MSTSQRNSPHSDSSTRAVTTAPAEHTHPRTTSATSSCCKRQVSHPLSIPSALLCKETAVKLAGKGVTRTRLAAGKGLRPTTSSLGEREMQTGCLELRGEQSFIFEAVSIAGGEAPADSRQAVRYYSRTGSAGPRRELAGTRGASTARRRARGRRAHGSRGRGCRTAPTAAVSPTPAQPRTSPAGTSSQTRHPTCGVRPWYRRALGRAPALRPLPPLSSGAPRPRAWSRSLRG